MRFLCLSYNVDFTHVFMHGGTEIVDEKRVKRRVTMKRIMSYFLRCVTRKTPVYTSALCGLLTLVLNSGGLHAMACDPCLAVPPISTWQMLDILMATQCVGTPIRQSDVPYTITASGVYSLCEDLISVGLAPVITVTASDVYLNLACHRINVIQSALAGTFGIFVDNSNRIIIANGSLVANIGFPLIAQPANLVTVNFSGAVLMRDLDFFTTATESSDTSVGVRLINSRFIAIDDCTFSFINFGIFATLSSSIKAESCTFIHTSSAAINTQNADNLQIRDCEFFSQGSYIMTNGGHGQLITDCLLQEGRIAMVTPVNAIIRNCLVNEAKRPVGVSHGIQITNGSCVIVENCTVQSLSGIGILYDGFSNHGIVRSCTVECTGTGVAFSATTTNCHVVNTLSAFAITENFSGFGIQFASDDVATSTVNYWLNVEYH